MIWEIRKELLIVTRHSLSPVEKDSISVISSAPNSVDFHSDVVDLESYGILDLRWRFFFGIM